jgi:hypothetical protein
MATTGLDEIDIGGHSDCRITEAGKTIVDEHPRSVEQVLDPAKALVALVWLLARLAAREAWDDGRARRHDPLHDTPKVARLPPPVRP